MIICVLTLPTLPRYSPSPRESKTPVDPRFTTEHLRCSTMEPRFVPVYPGVTQVVYGDVPVTAGYMPVGPRLRPGATLHYKTRIKTWSNISSLLSLAHNSYVFKEKNIEQTQIGLQSHIRVTRGNVIFVAKTNA